MSCCQCWIPVVTAVAISVVIHALLLLALYILLGRKIAQNSRGMRVKSSSGERPSPEPSPKPSPEPSPEPSPAAALAPGGDKAQPPGGQQPMAQHPAPAYGGSSDTSSDTSEDSADSPSHPQGPGSKEILNYSSLVFPGKGHEPGTAQDYENVKTGLDYVNVDPKKRKTHFWPFSSPRASRAVEYTEVKL